MFTEDAEGCRHSEPDQIICAGASPTPSCSATAAPETGAYRNTSTAGAAGALDVARQQPTAPRSRNGTYMSRWGGTPMPGQDPNQIRTVDQCTTGVSAGQPCEHGIANITFRAPNWGSHWTTVYNFRGSASYVMDAHNLKAGYQGSHLGDNQTNFSNDEFLSYRFNNGVPNQFTQTINRFTRHQWVRTAAFYVQDSYTVSRFTFQGALRYDRAWSYFPEQEIIPVRFSPRERRIRPPKARRTTI